MRQFWSAGLLRVPDRLEVESPGMLPFGYTLDDFVAGISHTRNKVIARVFRELHLMEEWGTGYRRIVEASQKGGYSIPDWEERGTTIKVRLHSHPITQEERSQLVPSVSSALPKQRQKEILSILHDRKMLTAKELYEHLKIHISERTLRNDLLELKESGLIAMVGSGPNTYWKFVRDDNK